MSVDASDYVSPALDEGGVIFEADLKNPVFDILSRTLGKERRSYVEVGKGVWFYFAETPAGVARLRKITAAADEAGIICLLDSEELDEVRREIFLALCG